MIDTALPVHPLTGLRALGYSKRGPIWPVAGAEDNPPDDPKPDDPKPPKNDDTPPWGDDKDFDAEKAWKLIRNLKKKTGIEDRDKKIADLEEENKKFKRDKMTEQQRAEAERDESKTRADSAEAKSLKLEVALDKAPDHMPAKKVAQLAKRLSGSTREELEADADELFADFTEPSDKRDNNNPMPRRPRERLRGGGDPDDGPDETDPRKLAARIPR